MVEIVLVSQKGMIVSFLLISLSPSLFIVWTELSVSLSFALVVQGTSHPTRCTLIYQETLRDEDRMDNDTLRYCLLVLL